MQQKIFLKEDLQTKSMRSHCQQTLTKGNSQEYTLGRRLVWDARRSEKQTQYYIWAWTEKIHLYKTKRRSYTVKKKNKRKLKYNVQNLGRMWLKLKCYILRERRITILIDLDFDKYLCLPDFLAVTRRVGTGWLPSLPYTVCSSNASGLLYLTQGYTSG